MALWTSDEGVWIAQWMRDCPGEVAVLLQKGLLEGDSLRATLASIAKDHANKYGPTESMPFVIGSPNRLAVMSEIAGERKRMSLDKGFHVEQYTNKIPHESSMTFTVEVIINSSGTRGTGEVRAACSGGTFTQSIVELVDGKATFEWTAPTLPEGTNKEFGIEVFHAEIGKSGVIPVVVTGPPKQQAEGPQPA